MYPILHPAVSIVELSDSELQIRALSDGLTFSKQNDNIRVLLDLCDGTRDVIQVRAEIRERDTFSSLKYLLEVFLSRGFLVHNTPDGIKDRAINHIDYSAKAVRKLDFVRNQIPKNIKGFKIAILGEGVCFLECLQRLEEYEFDVKTNPSFDELNSVELVLLVEDFSSQDKFRSLNKRLFSLTIPYVFASISDEKIQIGPFVLPNQTACFECFHHRLLSNSRFRKEAECSLNSIPYSVGKPNLYSSVLVFFVVSQIFKFIKGAWHHTLFGEVLDFDTLNYEVNVRSIMKLPRCDVCSSGRMNQFPERMIRDLI